MQQKSVGGIKSKPLFQNKGSQEGFAIIKSKFIFPQLLGR